ncbi:MAG TPA: hypothetical protein V6C97_32440 [Oculatellaceae cyanobacterium]
MTTNDKNLEGLKPQKSGDHQVAGTPITNTEDNAHQQRQEKITASKAFRFTSGDSAPFTIDMGNGEKVQDKRPIRQEASAGDQTAAATLNDRLPAGPDEASLANASPLKLVNPEHSKLDYDYIPKADLKDGQGHIVQKNYADGRHTDIHYDKNGQPDEVRTPDGQIYRKHIGKDGKPDGTWDVTVPKDNSPDGKEHHYNTKIDIKVDGDGNVSWTTKAGEHSQIDKDGKWHKDVVKEDTDALHTDLSKRDNLESAKKLCEQVNKDGDAADVYKRLLKEHPEDKDKVHLVTKFDENGKMKVELAPGPDPMDSILKQARTVTEAKEFSTALGTRDLGISAQAKLDEINKNGDGRGVYDKLSDADKKMVHLETIDGKEVMKLGPSPTPEQEKTTKEANELSQDLYRIDEGASARQMLKRINDEGNAEAVYNKLSDADKKMVHLEEHNGIKILSMGAEARPEYKEAKLENQASATRDASEANTEAKNINAMMDEVNKGTRSVSEVITEMQKFARTHASQFEAMCKELQHLNGFHFHVEKDDKSGKIKVTHAGGFGIGATTLYDGIPGPTGNGP